MAEPGITPWQGRRKRKLVRPETVAKAAETRAENNARLAGALLLLGYFQARRPLALDPDAKLSALLEDGRLILETLAELSACASPNHANRSARDRAAVVPSFVCTGCERVFCALCEGSGGAPGEPAEIGEHCDECWSKWRAAQDAIEVSRLPDVPALLPALEDLGPLEDTRDIDEVIERVKRGEPAAKVVCWGCECGVPLDDRGHVEPTDIPGTVYAYPCTRAL